MSATPWPTRDPLAFVTTLTQLPSRAELHDDAAAPENPGRSVVDPWPVSPPLSAAPETIRDAGGAGDAR